MAIQFDGLALTNLAALPINPVQGEVAYDTALRIWDGSAWVTFNPVDPSGESSTITMASGEVILNDAGTKTDPSYSFSGDDDSGIYSSGANAIGLVGNGEEILNLLASSTPANYWQMESSDAASPVELKSLGDDTDIDMLLTPKGDGVIQVPAGYEGRSNFGDDSLVNKEYVDNAIGAGAAGNDREIQFNNSGSFGASPHLTFTNPANSANLRITETTDAYLWFQREAAAANEEKWRMGVNTSDNFVISAVNDAEGSSASFLQAVRGTGATVTELDLLVDVDLRNNKLFSSIGNLQIDISQSATPAVGGNIDIDAGQGNTNVGGNVDIDAGAAAGGNFAGGNVNVTGGVAASSGSAASGGTVTLTGGAAAGPGGQGGEVVLAEGGGSGGGDNGVIRVSGVMVAENQIRAGAIYDTNIGRSIQILAQDNATGTGGDMTLDAGEGGTNGAGGEAYFRAGRGSGSGDGGKTTVSAGDGGITGDGANLDLLSGSGGSTSGSGGDVNVTAGGRQAGAGDGGNVNITAGDGSSTGVGGAVFIRPGYGGGSAPSIPTVSGIPQPAEFWFVDGDNTTSGYVGFKAPADVGAAVTGDGVDTVWTLPEGEGSPNQVMTTDGTGILAWSSTIQGPSGFGVSGSDAFILGGDTDGVGGSVNGGNVNITGGTIVGGAGSGSGGAVLIDGGAGVSLSGGEAGAVVGGDVSIAGGVGAADGGGGVNTDTSGGNVFVAGGAAGAGGVGATASNGGNVQIAGGAGATGSAPHASGHPPCSAGGGDPPSDPRSVRGSPRG